MRKTTVFLMAVLLSFGAFALENDDEKDKKKKKQQARPDLPGILLIDVGFNFLPDSPEGMDIGFWGSKIVNFYYYWDIPIGKSHFSFGPGLGLGLEKYSFEDNNTLTRDNAGNTQVSDLFDLLDDDVDIRKSKIAANYIDVPIEFRFHVNKENHDRGFRAAVGGKVGFLFAGHTKVKYEEDGDNKKIKRKDNFNMQRLRYGLTARIGFPGINLFGYYGLSELFESGSGPDETTATPFNLGISISGF